MKILNLSLIALLSTQCTAPKEEEEKNELGSVIPDVSSSMIDLPTAIASEGAYLKLTDDDGIRGFFMIPVTYSGIARTMNALSRDLVAHIFGKAVCTDKDRSNDLPDCEEYSGLITGTLSEEPIVIELPDSEGSSGPRYVKYWKNPEGSAYELGIELYFANAQEKYFPALQMQLSKTEEQLGKGEFKFFPNFDELGQGLESIVTQFEATTEKKTLDVRVYFAPAADGPSSLGLNVTDKDGIITGAGTAIRPEQDGIEGPIAPFQKNAEYAFVWTLAADAESNIAVEKFAAVDASGYADSTAYFTHYGVDSILKNFALDLLRTDVSGLDCSNIGSIIDASLPSDICRTNTAVTDTQVLNGLKTLCIDNPDDDICTLAGQVNVWANPVYLDNKGYVGNEIYNKPTDSQYAPLVQALGALSIYTPTAFKALEKPVAPAAVDAVN